MNGQPFDPEAVYAVITSNANFNGMDSSYIFAAAAEEKRNGQNPETSAKAAAKQKKIRRLSEKSTMKTLRPKLYRAQTDFFTRQGRGTAHPRRMKKQGYAPAS